MKKLILALLFLLLSCSISFAENQQLAWMGPVIVGSGYQSSASCTISNDTELISQGGTGNNTSLLANCIATKITVTENTYITEIIPYVSFSGGAAYMTCSLFTVGGTNKPDTEVSGTSVTNNIEVGAGYKTMTLSSAVLLSGTSYYAVCKSLGSTAAIWYRNTTGGESTGATNTSGSCGTWGSVGTSSYDIKINGCAP